jgi:hypothetical protein
MSPFTLLLVRNLARSGCRHSSSDGSARLPAALVPQLALPFPLHYILAPLPNTPIVHSNVRHQQTLPVAPHHYTAFAQLKSP